MNVTASTNLQIGNYQALKAAHLSHDEEKYNSNKDIDYELKKYNTHKKYVDNMDEWKDENYEEPIREFNGRQKNKSRRFDDYSDYRKRQAEKGSRNQDIELSPNRLMIMNFADMASNENMKDFFTRRNKNKKMTEKEYYEMMAAGMDLAVERFNEKYEHLQITESFTHVNEGSPHTHCDLWVKGTDKFGKPFVDINDGLYAHYGKTRTVEKKNKDGTTENKDVRMTHKALWETFRRDIDENIIHQSMMDAIKEHYGRGVSGINFHRKESDIVGVNHDVFKDTAKKVTQQERKQLKQRSDKLDEREKHIKKEFLTEYDKLEQEKEAFEQEKQEFQEEKEDYQLMNDVTGAVAMAVFKNDPKRQHMYHEIKKDGINRYWYQGKPDTVLVTRSIIASLEEAKESGRKIESEDFIHQEAIKMQEERRETATHQRVVEQDDGPEL